MSVNQLLCGCRSKLFNIIGLTLGGTLRNRAVAAFCRTNRNYSSKNIHNLSLKQKKFLDADKLPSSYSLIYRAPLSKYVIVAATSTTVLTLAASVSAALTYLLTDTGLDVELTYSDSVISGTFNEAVAFVCLTSLITLVLLIMSRRYVLRVYRRNGDFIAIYAGAIPGFNRKFAFKAGSVVYLPTTYKILPWATNLYKIDGRKSILLEDHFRTFRDLNEMMLGENKDKSDDAENK